MPYFKSSQEWVEQSLLLLEARPSTTRVTTRYSIKAARRGARKSLEGSSSSAAAAAASADADAGPARPPRGSLVLKTYDPVSGVTLKYRTAKAAEVSRLAYSALGRLARAMAAVPAEHIEEPTLDVTPATDVAAKDKPEASHGQAPHQGGTAKRKKKGRK